MKILAIDTSREICSIAVMEDGKILKLVASKSEKEHSQTLMPKIKQTLESIKLKIDDINLLSCSRGPGSFTGIRVGMATIKAFADAKNIPIAGVDSLKAQAYGVLVKKGRKECKILSMIDAKNENVYFAVYKVHNGNLSLFKMDKLEPLLSAKHSKQYAQGKKTENYEFVEDLPEMAESIAVCAQDKYKIGDYGDSSTLFPMYLRKPQAQRQIEGEDEKIAIWELSSLDLEQIKKDSSKTK